VNNEEKNGELFEALRPTADQRDRMLRAILSESAAGAAGAASRRSPLRALPVPAAICLALLLTATAATATVLRWDEALIAFLRPTDAQMESLADAADNPLASVTQNGVTVSVKQTLADSRGVYVLYEINVPSYITLNDDIVFARSSFRVPSEDARFGVMEAPKTLKQSAHARTALLYSYTDGTIANQKLRLHFGALGYYEGSADADDFHFLPLIEGDWVLEWDFSYKDTSRRIEVNREIEFKGRSGYVTDIFISPLSLFLYIEGGSQGPGWAPVIRFKNGDAVTIEGSMFTSQVNEDGSVAENRGVFTFAYCFDRVTDLSEIESVAIGDAIIPIS
jgi:hypothetical protein